MDMFVIFMILNVIPVQAFNYLSGENAIKGCCKLCYWHLLSTFTLEWLWQAGLHNSYQMDGKDWSAEWVQSDQKQRAKMLWTKIHQELPEEKMGLNSHDFGVST